MNNFIEALKEIKKESKDFKITLSKKEVLEITDEIDRLHSIIKEVREEVRILESNCDISNYHAQKLYQILDKENKYV